MFAKDFEQRGDIASNEGKGNVTISILKSKISRKLTKILQKTRFQTSFK